MRRTLLICLMLFLPLQWSWAAAAGICQHESASTASHFGHHVHEHHAAGIDGDNKPDASGTVHTDCAVCHFAAAAKVGNEASVLPDVERAAVLRTAALPHFTSHIPGLPERPDRASRPDSA